MKTIKKYLNRYFIDGLGAMALGLFSTLIIGTILAQIGELVATYLSVKIGAYIIYAANVAKMLTGAGIGVAVASKFKCSPMLCVSAGVAGLIGAFPSSVSEIFTIGAAESVKPGEPLGAFIAALFAIEIGRLVAGKTKLDIILTPLVSISAGSAVAFLISTPISSFMTWLGSLVNISVDNQPIIGGIVVSVLMGIFLTLPISSAAIGISMKLGGLAAGAACIGCACQMMGFAAISYRDNGIGGSISQGIGTSMLQMPNIMRKPTIWLAPILSSAVLGPVSSALLKMENNAIGSGMGTSGFVGPLQCFKTMSESLGSLETVALIVAMYFILPAVVTLFFDLILRKLGLYKKGDMTLPSLK